MVAALVRPGDYSGWRDGAIVGALGGCETRNEPKELRVLVIGGGCLTG